MLWTTVAQCVSKIVTCTSVRIRGAFSFSIAKSISDALVKATEFRLVGRDSVEPTCCSDAALSADQRVAAGAARIYGDRAPSLQFSSRTTRQQLDREASASDRAARKQRRLLLGR